MKQKNVYSELLSKMGSVGGLSFLVIDPPDYTPQDAAKIAKLAEEAGFDAFAVGGSVGAQGELLDYVVKAIKENANLPVILFPGNIATITKYADAIYFMSMLNSRDPYYITGAQVASAIPIKKMGLEVIPTSYLIMEPGRAVGWVGQANLIPRDIEYIAGINALAGQYMGSKMVILESGSGAETPCPPKIISYARKLIDIPIVVAGGVRNEKFAYDCIKAGADIVHVGNSIKSRADSPDEAKKFMQKIVQSVRKAGKEKLAKGH